MIEIDLHTTSDGVVVVRHDAKLDRIGGRAEIGDATFEALRALDAGDGERVPTLNEVLDEFGSKIPFNLEFKRGRAGCYTGLEAVVLEALERRGIANQTLLSSFEMPVLRELRSLSPAARLAVLASPRDPERLLERAEEVGAEAINPHFAMVDEAMVRQAHDSGLSIFVYTVDEGQRMKEQLDLGVDGLFTNRPDRMRALVDGR